LHSTDDQFLQITFPFLYIYNIWIYIIFFRTIFCSQVKNKFGMWYKFEIIIQHKTHGEFVKSSLSFYHWRIDLSKFCVKCVLFCEQFQEAIFILSRCLSTCPCRLCLQQFVNKLLLVVFVQELTRIAYRKIMLERWRNLQGARLLVNYMITKNHDAYFIQSSLISRRQYGAR